MGWSFGHFGKAFPQYAWNPVCSKNIGELRWSSPTAQYLAINKTDVTPNSSRGTLAAQDAEDHREILEIKEAR